MEATHARRTRLVGWIDGAGKSRRLRHLIDEDASTPLPASAGLADAAEGSVVEARLTGDGGLKQPALLAEPDTALAKMYGIAGRHRLDPVFPEAVEQEVARRIAAPDLDDPALEDLRAMPFVSVDGPGTRDLDQAMYVTDAGGELTVYYALADAAWCVRAGTALFDEALRRGATYYLPGLAIPMLPRPLSEGLLSLNEKVDRRALVFRMTLDGSGRCRRTELIRGLIHSRGQLTFEQVERHLRDPGSTPMADGVGRSLQLFKQVGELRMADADRRDVVRYRRSESEVKLGGVRGCRFVITGGLRGDVERYNEQLSLMCNVEGARFLHRNAGAHAYVQPIYRVHPSPDPRRYAELEQLLGALRRRHDLHGSTWVWRRNGDRSLASFLERLPQQGALGRLARAIHRQAVMANVRSVFSPEPGKHHGVGADVYARFSAPMREIVGVFLHKEALEKLAGRGSDDPADEALREHIVQTANRAKSLQKQITKEANEMVLDQLFGEDLRRTLAERPTRSGTVMGLTPSKVHVLLDAPQVEVKLYLKHQAQLLDEHVEVSRDGVQLRCGPVDGGAETRRKARSLCRIGDEVKVRLRDRDKPGQRWVLELV